MEPVVVTFSAVGFTHLDVCPVPFKDVNIRQDTVMHLRGRALNIPGIQCPYPLKPNAVAKDLADRIWNALGREDCPLFDSEGQYHHELTWAGRRIY
jgi:hypothetical protein